MRGVLVVSCLVVVVIRTEDKPRAAFRLFRTMEKAGTTFDGHHNRKQYGAGVSILITFRAGEKRSAKRGD